jgi:hypothetical protein
MARLPNSLRACLVALVCAAVLPAASSQTAPPLERFSFSVGGFRNGPLIGAGLDTDFGLLATGDLRPNPSWTPRLRAELLLLERQGFAFDYFRYHRGFGQPLDSTARTGFGTVRTSGRADLDVHLEVARMSWRWWLGSGSTLIGPGIGAGHYRAKLDARVAAALDTPLGSATGRIDETFSEHAWAPLLELSVRHALTPDLRLTANASGMRRGGSGLRGSIFMAAAGVEWFPTRTVGVSLDMSITDFDIDRRRGNVDTDLRVRLRGPTASVKVRL